MKIYCISIYDQNYNFFKSNNLIPVGLGKKKFNRKWFDDKSKRNISSKNENFGEYTFHYSLWKNNLLNKKNTSWTGFCTYRRFWVKKGYKTPKTLKDLDKIILKKVPNEWKGYDTVLPKPLKLGKLKVMKLLKNNFKELLRKPSLLYKKCTIRDHFNLFHGDYFLKEAIKLLDPKERYEFELFLNKYEFNPHNIFICRNHSLINKYYNDVFKWLFKCEKNFKNLKLDTYGKKRIYGFLAERYMPFWFKKNSKTIDWPFVFFDTNKYERL
jgi:hypothetical protein